VGTFRTHHRDVWDAARRVIEDALAEILAGYRLELLLDHRRGAPPVVNDAAVTAMVARAAAAALGEAAVVEAEPSQGGEDFSFYLDHVPGTYCRLGVARPDVVGPAPALHTSLFDVDEQAISVGIRFLVHAVLEAQRRLGPGV
jgi:metal-dependent amidase/aminoacylase/carboxypeptidase family protein